MAAEAHMVQPQPWRPGSLVAAVVGNGIGLFLVGLAWYGASGTGYPATQVSWLAAAVMGSAVIAIVNAIWLFFGRRNVGMRYHELFANWASEESDAGAVITPLDQPVAAPGMRWYHRPNCHLTQGKDLRTAARVEHERNGLQPCGICRP